MLIYFYYIFNMHKYLKYKNKYLQLKNQIGGNTALSRLKEALENPSDLLLHVMNNDMTLIGIVKPNDDKFTKENVKDYINPIFCSIISSMEFREYNKDCKIGLKPSTSKYIDWIIKSFVNGTIIDIGLLFGIVKKIKDYMKIPNPLLDSFYGYNSHYILSNKLFFKDFMEDFVVPKVIKSGLVMYDNDIYNGEYIIIDEDELPVKNRRGILKYSNGDIYDGEFKNDMRDGRGILKYSNGDTYNGFFTAGTILNDTI